jgi:ABC-type transport system involved in multi-copper enzyme maturation permease subunit
MREEEPTVARYVGLIGLVLVALGTTAVFVNAIGRTSRWIGPNLGAMFLVTGLGGLLFHATRDRDLQIRRLYGALAFLLLGAGVLLRLIPYDGHVGGLFLRFGYPCLLLSLFFLMPFIRNETEPRLHGLAVRVLGLAGLVMLAVGFFGSSYSADYLIGEGLLLLVLGLFYLWAFVGVQGVSSDWGYWSGLGIGAAGLLMFLIALGRSVLPDLLYKWNWVSEPPAGYLMPNGLVMMAVGLVYVLVAAGLCLDNRLVVLTRRELSAYFYSPIAYIVLFGITVIGWFMFWDFVRDLEVRMEVNQPVFEPIIGRYIFGLFPVICVIFIVPVLTMRLLSEEQRNGTLEVLLTAPVDETSVVLSKFFAALIFFLIAWVPWGLFLVALRVLGGQAFDYRPFLSFAIVLLFTGSGFLSMGLFFSSLTRNQIASAILTFMCMIALTAVLFIKGNLEPGSYWNEVLNYISYVDLWWNSVSGTFAPRYLLFHLSACIFWLFLTVKVLESRKWS